MSEVLRELGEALAARRSADPDSSYVAGLMHKGEAAILKKIGEEATETVLAGTGEDSQALVHETADLWFHTLILLAYRGLEPDAVLQELERRMGTSGLTEKARRQEGP